MFLIEFENRIQDNPSIYGDYDLSTQEHICSRDEVF